MRKLYYLISIVSGLLIIYLFFIFSPHNYKFTYRVNDIPIVESYNKKDGIYNLIIDDKYTFSFAYQYTRHRGIVSKIIKKDNCISLDTNFFENFSLCQNDNYTYLDGYDKEIKSDIKVSADGYALYDETISNIYFWDYTHFININNGEEEIIELFASDVYELDVITKMDRYLVVADYNDKYKFDSLFMINTKNNKVSEVKLEYAIYFNSYFLGSHKKNLYIYDIQKETEYEIQPFKDETKKVSYQILKDNKWEKVTATKLNKKELVFTSSENKRYIVEDDLLFYQINNSKILVSNLKVDRFVDTFANDAYFISDDTLYVVNLFNGVKKLISCNEWKYSNKNIYIFN